ncbi:MAG: ribosome small subunit-dependent GTPase A [Planctomycetes bacterium]|nr:ribosome small subunit-dependent GTPase A [Planctomycetota bacterium]
MTGALGTVTRVDSRVCWVRCDDGALRKCSLRGRLFHSDSEARNPVAVGDRVELSAGEHEEEGRVEAVLPRRNKLSRPVAASAGRFEQVIVANVDCLAVVVAAAEPRLRPGLIDRYLIVAGRQRIEPVVVVNKIDLVDRAALAAALAVFHELGERLVYTSATRGDGLAELRQILAGKRTVFAGHSGVGKSALLSALVPGLDLETRRVSRKTDRGVHTTTRVTLFELEGGGALIDTPGVRALGLWRIEPEEVDAYFREITAAARQCRFRGCTHDHEPGCAVKAAVEAGAIDARRFASFRRIFVSLAEERRERGY